VSGSGLEVWVAGMGLEIGSYEGPTHRKILVDNKIERRR
jgi:hypothetical protein